MRQLGIILDNFTPSQINFYAQVGANQAIHERWLDDVILFYIDKTTVMNHPKLSTAHISDLTCFPGDVIATSIRGTLKLLLMPIVGEKWFYIYNPEWLMGSTFSVTQMSKIYRHRDLKYVVRTELYSQLLRNNFNTKPELVMEDFNLEVMYGR